MTRFARAKGSKSSNERVPEDATSWREMKQQLTEKKQEVEENKKRKKAEENRKKNYQNFLDDLENEKKEEWAEFDDEEAKTGRVQKKRKVESERFEELVGQIEEVLKKEKENKVEAKAKKQKVNKEDSKETKIKCNGNKKTKKAGIEPKKPNEELVEEEKKVKKKKQKQLKVTNKSTESSNKNNTKVLKNGAAKPKQTQIKVKKPYEELTEEEKAKVDKKKEQKQKQKEKKKQFKTTNKTVEQPNQNNRKPPKPRDNKEHRRRKPNPANSTTMNINGVEVKISYFDGFPIKSEDAERLQKLRKEMISKGVPRSEVQTAMKLERRKAEKALAREKKKVCFNCRKSGHVLSECPNLTGSNSGVETVASGVCFKCGSTEHTHFECRVVRGDDYKFASCFICKEQGHISRQCPDNNRGLYPKGGACKVCGDVTHLKKDCPKYQAQQQALNIDVDSMSFDNVEGIDNADNYNFKNKRVNKVIKF